MSNMQSKPNSIYASNLNMSQRLQHAYRGVKISGTVVADEVEAFHRILVGTCTRITKETQETLSTLSPLTVFAHNDTLQAVPEQSIVALKTPAAWEKRQSTLRAIVSPHTDAALALIRGDRAALTNAGFAKEDGDPKGFTYVKASVGIVMHHWQSARDARRWMTRSSNVHQACVEYRLTPVTCPCTLLVNTRGFFVSFSVVVPITDEAPSKSVKTSLESAAAVLGLTLGTLQSSADDDDGEATLEALSRLTNVTPSTKLSAADIDARLGLDGRVYCMNPTVVGIDLVRAATGSFAAEMLMEAAPTVRPESYHLLFPKGLSTQPAPSAKTIMTSFTAVVLDHVEKALLQRAAELAKAAGGSLKLMDLLQHDVISTAMRNLGVNKCMLHALLTKLKGSTSPLAAALAEITEAEMVFRALKVIIRSEVLVAADRSDAALLDVVSRCFALFATGDAPFVNVLQRIARSKFAPGAPYDVAVSPKATKIVMYFLNARLGIAVDQATNKVTKFSTPPPTSATPAPPELVKTAQRATDGASSPATSLYQLPTAVWLRLEDGPEKALRLTRAAIIGYLGNLKPEPALEALAKWPQIAGPESDDDAIFILTAGTAAFAVAQMDDVPRTSVQKLASHYAKSCEIACDAKRPADVVTAARLRQSSDHFRRAFGLISYFALEQPQANPAFAPASLLPSVRGAVSGQAAGGAENLPLLCAAALHLAWLLPHTAQVANAYGAALRATLRAGTALLTSDAHSVAIPVQLLQPAALRSLRSIVRAKGDIVSCSNVFEAACTLVLDDALRRAANAPGDLASVLSTVRLAAIAACAAHPQNGSSKKLAEYVSYLDDIMSTEAPANATNATQWASFYAAKDVGAVQEVVETKPFATCLAGVCLECLWPAGQRWHVMIAVSRCFDAHGASVLWGAAGSPKVAELAALLQRANECAARIQRYAMPRVVHSAKSRATPALRAKWPPVAKKGGWTTPLLTYGADLWIVGHRLVEAQRRHRIAVAHITSLASVANAATVRTEADEWRSIQASFAKVAGGTMLLNMERDEHAARSEITADECTALTPSVAAALEERYALTLNYLFDTLVAPAKAFYGFLNVIPAMEAIVSDEAPARFAIMRRELTERAEMDLRQIIESLMELDVLTKNMESTAAKATVARDEDTERCNIYSDVAAERLILANRHESVVRGALEDDIASQLIAAFVAGCEEILRSLMRVAVSTFATIQDSMVAAAVAQRLQELEAAEREAREAIFVANLQSVQEQFQHLEELHRAGKAGAEEAERGSICRGETRSREVEVPELLQRSVVVDAALLAYGPFVEGLAMAFLKGVAAAAAAEFPRLSQVQEAVQRRLLVLSAFSAIAAAVNNLFNNDLRLHISAAETTARTAIGEAAMIQRKCIQITEVARERERNFLLWGLVAHEIRSSNFERALVQLRVKKHNEGVGRLMLELERAEAAKRNLKVLPDFAVSLSKVLITAHGEYGAATLKEHIAAQRYTAQHMEKSRRRALESPLKGKWLVTLWRTFEPDMRSAVAATERRERNFCKRFVAVHVDEFTERQQMLEQSAKVYEDVAKVMSLLARALLAGPRASLMAPSERRILMRKEAGAPPNPASDSVGSPVAAAAPERTVPPMSSQIFQPQHQRDVPLEAVVLQQPTLLQQSEILENIVAMRAQELLALAMAEGEQRHREWLQSPFTDHDGTHSPHVVLLDDDSPPPPPKPLSPRSFANAVTKLAATEMWRRQQVLHVQAEFMSSCRVEFQEVDTLMRGERRLHPRTTLILSLPLLSPFYFTCFRELAHRMTKTPDQRAKSKNGASHTKPNALSSKGRRHSPTQNSLSTHNARNRLTSISSIGTSLSSQSMSGGLKLFDDLSSMVSRLKKLLVTCDRGVSAVYAEEDKAWIHLQARERFGRTTITEAASLVSAAHRENTSVLETDPTQAKHLALPSERLPTRDSVAVAEAEHRLKVAMAEAEHRFDMLQRLIRELPKPSLLDQVAASGRRLPFYLDERVLRRAASKRKPPVKLDVSPSRGVTGNRTAGSSGYSFYQSPNHSHSPDRAPRRQHQLSPIRTTKSTSLARSSAVMVSMSMDEPAPSTPGSSARIPLRRGTLPPMQPDPSSPDSLTTGSPTAEREGSPDVDEQ
jgi:hypothetical protein